MVHILCVHIEYVTDKTCRLPIMGDMSDSWTVTVTAAAAAVRHQLDNC
jgi:hypothetical protein